MNIHSQKYSGIANSKAIAVTATPTGSLKISTRTADASPHTVKGARSTKTIKARSGGRKALGVAAQYAKAGYRPDLRAVRLFLVGYRTCFYLWLDIGLVGYDWSRAGVKTQDAISLEPTGYFLKDGRGHVCKSDPSLRGTDQAHAGHLVIRYRAP